MSYSQQYGETPPYTQQPSAVPQMSLSGGNKNALEKPFNHNNQRPWSHGLCSCFGDCSTCCVSWFCPCIVWGQNKTRLEYLERTGRPHPDGGESFGNDCMIHGLLTVCGGVGWVLQINTRNQTRERYRIEGSLISDLFTSWCCHPCALTQESREIELEEQSLMGHQNMYVTHGPMVQEPKPVHSPSGSGSQVPMSHQV